MLIHVSFHDPQPMIPEADPREICPFLYPIVLVFWFFGKPLSHRVFQLSQRLVSQLYIIGIKFLESLQNYVVTFMSQKVVTSEIRQFMLISSFHKFSYLPFLFQVQ